MIRLGALACAVSLAVAGCDGAAPDAPARASVAPPPPAAPGDVELDDCAARWQAVEATPAEPGAPGLEARRAALLGRARGPSLLFVRAPAPAPTLPAAASAAMTGWAKQAPGIRVAKLRAALGRDPAALRAALLREGYAYAEDPEDAFEIVEHVGLGDLFDDDEIVLERGATRSRLARAKIDRTWRYAYADGPRRGKPAQLLFGDRVARTDADLGAPLHVDVGAFADGAGFDRVRPLRVTHDAVLAELRVAPAGVRVRAVLERTGATLRLGCLVAPRAARDAVLTGVRDDAWRRRSIAEMRAAIDAMVDDALPFDRPRGEEGPDRDGALRPHWTSAYRAGRQGFEVDGEAYPVFGADGVAAPPTVCVDFVLDTWERASGSWFRPRGEPPGRTKGRLDLDAEGIANRRGVLGFGAFAAERTDLFETRRFVGAERVPFAERDAFFAGLVKGADEGDPLRPGDVVAIQGLKRDHRVHQHAILVETVDPVSGLPQGLADQMKRPRRRTWEGIMREAPQRSLLFRVRPTRALFERLAQER